ncbi:MAG: hypothetical protein QXQ39_03995 [Conexivisphaerales archaeon]
MLTIQANGAPIAVVGNGHDGSIYSLFRCKECGQVVNADRKASLAVAIKTLVLRKRFLTRIVPD